VKQTDSNREDDAGTTVLGLNPGKAGDWRMPNVVVAARSVAAELSEDAVAGASGSIKFTGTTNAWS
jgi:hypothetical protein